MPLISKFHKKFEKPKQATVSLDSLLGLLSSAYGTKELDSKTVFDNNIVNWNNISAESFRPSNKDAGDKRNNLKHEECGKVNAATSTTSLKPNKQTGSEIDVTLVSVKSLPRLKQSNNRKLDIESGIASKVAGEHEENSKLNTPLAEVGLPQIQTEEANLSADNFEVQTKKVEQQSLVMCGFFVDDSNHKVIFDIQFLNKITQASIIPLFDIGNTDVTINATDILKGTKCCIKVGKKHLVSKIQYFADVDKEFGLENLDVVVKGDLNAIQWVLQWVNANVAICKPNLNASNLKMILSMAYHLGITQLLEECLHYFHQNCVEVLGKDCAIEDVFNDDLLTKLIKLYSPGDIDKVNDNFESFQMKMYCTRIKLLVDTNPNNKLGHYSTLATLFLCGSCEKFLQPEMTCLVPCRSDCNQLDFEGNLIYFHERSPSWDLSRYIELMHENINSWKLVYWHLWGMCHFLSCSVCHSPYPLCQSEWCSYHPEEVEYFPMNPNGLYPIGMYKCCGEKTFRFSVLKPYNGCRFRSHKPQLDSTNKVEIHKIYRMYKDYINLPQPESVGLKKFVKLVKTFAVGELLPNETSENLWWEGILLAPKEKKDYSIIPLSVINQLRNKVVEKKCEKECKPLVYKRQVQFGIMPSGVSEKTQINEKIEPVNENCLAKNKKKMKSSSKKAKLNTIPPLKLRTKRKKQFMYQPMETLWMKTLTNKDNQDNQRDFEEIAMRNLVKILSPDTSVGLATEPVAGSYIRLEADWWQEHCSGVRIASNTKNCNTGTVVNRTFPRSWFRRLTI